MTDNPQIEVCLSPNLFPLFDVKGKIVVVIDVLRASTTMIYALHNGMDSVIPVSTVEECLSHSNKNHYILAAERNGKKPDGFKYGNSPFDYEGEEVKGKTLVLTTTNGTKCIKMSEEADEIIIGSFINLNATVSYLGKQNKDIVLFCAGWKGHFNFEDTLFAGAVVDRLKTVFGFTQDSTLMARQLYVNAENHLLDVVKKSSHYNRLAKLGIERDIEFCLTPNQADVVPIYKDGNLTAAE